MHNLVEQLGHVKVTDGAIQVLDGVNKEQDFWPRHLRAFIPGKSVLSLIQLPKGLLAVATDRERTETVIMTAEEFSEKRNG